MPEFLTLEEIAQTLNVSIKTVRRKCETGELVYHRVGQLIRVSKDDFNNYLNSIKKEKNENE